MKTFFISSTFKDMQAERDILHEQVFPRLRSLIKSFGEEVQEVDLRWGVDTVNMTEEESGHEVLKICIDAIDRCKPYMIVLLGERYGWIPGKAIVDSAQDLRISHRYEQEMSITELEIQYGALLDEEAFDNCVFCFRDSGILDRIDPDRQANYRTESPLHGWRLTALKNQIRAKKNACILEYTADWDPERRTLCNLDAFAEQVYARLAEIIRKDLQGQSIKTPMERQVAEIALIGDGYLASYVRRYPEEFWITKHIAQFRHEISHYEKKRKTDCLLVCGDAGSGKSALMAYAARMTPSMEGKTILCFAAAAGCKDAASLKRYIAYQLESLLSLPHKDNPASVDQYLRTLDKNAEKQGIVCFVDALDQIYQGQQDPYLDLPALCPNLFWIFSALPDFPFAKAAADYTYHTVHVGGLLGDQREELIRRTAKKRGKQLDAELVNIITGSKGAHNPLFLSLVLQRLFMMNQAEFEAAEAIAPGMEGLHRYMQSLLTQMPDLPERMAVYVLDVTAKLFDQTQFSEILMLLACSHNGLTESELEGILALEGLRFSPIKFQQTVSYLFDAFDRRDSGKWTFHHRLFHEALLRGMTDEDRLRIGDFLVKYALSDEDFLRREGFRYLLQQQHPYFTRVLEEAVTWQNKAEVISAVGIAAREDSGFRSFLIRLAKAHPSDAMAAFWLDFEDFLYGDAVEAMAAEIVSFLLTTPVSHGKKWQLCLRRTYDADKEDLLSLLAQAEAAAQTLPEPDRTVALASIHAELTRCLTSLRKPYDEIRIPLRKSLAFVDRVMALPDRNLPWKNYITLLESLRIANRMAIVWDDPESDKLWLHALEITETLRPSTVEEEDDYTYYRTLFLCELCEIYCRRPWRNYETAQRYGEEAIELTEAAASQRPTMRNLKNRSNAISAYVRILKEEHTVPYRRQLIDCARQIYAAQKSDNNKRQVAVMEFEYGIAWFKAMKAGAGHSLPEKKKETLVFMDHGSALFEELWAADFSHSALAVYAALLAERAELQCDPPSESLKFGHRALELIARRQAETQETDTHQQNWCIGWSARTYTAMATAAAELTDYESCLRYAREGMALALERAKTSAAYYSEVLTCALFVAQSSYCLRRDGEALKACDEATALLDRIGSAGEGREPFDAELLYIRSRIALDRGETDAAWELYRTCLSKRKTALLHNKLLILKADCLEAMGDAQSDHAWREALRVWRGELAKCTKSFQSQLQHIRSLDRNPGDVQIPWRAAGVFTLPAYYMAYCYHHYVTDKKRMRENYDCFERKVLFALYYQGKGDLKGRMPYGMTQRIPDLPQLPPLPERPDFADLISALESMADTGAVPAACTLIRDNIDRFPDVIPDEAQFDRLHTVAGALYDHLIKQQRDMYHEKQECDLLKKLFCLDHAFPVCKIDIDWEGDAASVWPAEYAEGIADCWYALLKLFLLLLRRNSRGKDFRYATLRSVYRIVSGQIGGSEEIEKADLRFLSGQELEGLLASYDRENELRIIIGNLYWYALKNVWTAELYRRTGDPEGITRRLAELEEFLTEPYAHVYQQLDVRRGTDMATEVVNGVMHLVRSLNEREGERMALPVIRWAQSIPEIAGRLNSKTLYSVQTFREEDRLWLEEVKMQHCKTWLDAGGDTLHAVLLK